jgi:hypothetical protein
MTIGAVRAPSPTSPLQLFVHLPQAFFFFFCAHGACHEGGWCVLLMLVYRAAVK